MSDFIKNLFGKSIEKDLSKNDGKSPIDAALSNPMVRQMAKSYRKEILFSLESGEKDLIKLIESIPLQEGETQAAPIIDIDINASGEKEIRLIVAAFSGTALTRVITDIPLRQYLTKWYETKLK